MHGSRAYEWRADGRTLSLLALPPHPSGRAASALSPKAAADPDDQDHHEEREEDQGELKRTDVH